MQSGRWPCVGDCCLCGPGSADLTPAEGSGLGEEGAPRPVPEPDLCLPGVHSAALAVQLRHEPAGPGEGPHGAEGGGQGPGPLGGTAARPCQGALGRDPGPGTDGTQP
ncbi:Hypothetical predicted protein [Marmota monax]|uniref:Uncharacterized protein n=1 Tax=Marmota monax TaxID=9995 RepID=A0A5E4D1B1_MARMO|nr:Hypothetical predicted protein [Marmota monax]